MLEVPPPCSRTSKEAGVSFVTYNPSESPFGVKKTWYSTPVLTVWTYVGSSEITAVPPDNWPDPKSSNQLSGDPIALRATWREPSFTLTGVVILPVQFRLPLTSIVQPPWNALLKTLSKRADESVPSYPTTRSVS